MNVLIAASDFGDRLCIFHCSREARSIVSRRHVSTGITVIRAVGPSVGTVVTMMVTVKETRRRREGGDGSPTTRRSWRRMPLVRRMRGGRSGEGGDFAFQGGNFLCKLVLLGTAGEGVTAGLGLHRGQVQAHVGGKAVVGAGSETRVRGDIVVDVLFESGEGRQRGFEMVVSCVSLDGSASLNQLAKSRGKLSDVRIKIFKVRKLLFEVVGELQYVCFGALAVEEDHCRDDGVARVVVHSDDGVADMLPVRFAD